MGRFKENEPEKVELTAEQKGQLHEVDKVIDSKIAEKKIILEGRISEAQLSGDTEKVEKVRQELAKELSRLESDREKRKERIRGAVAEA
ncbi:MAG: hypothetical protein COS85_03040 [Armatimonadetes bacterium CG07_land_8_20_14_0_80_59_28]|nr:MAG: hypothetical protein COS85_03040 [Armatimonadetes bacterium CG07_land_8_20_14_0_80_59_28]PIX41183.1 MAG: hypothetical protein COZ56_12760 [Armatimonadetes bacterium CG_4_8_14_3_um_filter_58_9]PIY43068.1 MAG: hypothetical protein COZ05_12150 [Armatimonadetes bacterium CG_4_10_14_3_um_filter_59_10]PJB69333.1 MAG: hypothetical protein CO095_10115 [Armatimonadetes bacterium CG_4_9_14_3_um_filter_58_7]